MPAWGNGPVRVEIIRDRQPAGGGLAGRELLDIFPAKLGHTGTDAVIDWLRPFRPNLTSRSGVYGFDAPELGAGILTVTQIRPLTRARLDDRVRVLEIERALGAPEPARLPDFPLAQSGWRLHVNNPYLQLLIGAFAIGSGGLIIAQVVVDRTDGIAGAVLLCLLGAALIAAGTLIWFQRGLRRVRWWHRARAAGKRGNRTLPEDLRFFS